MMLVCNGFPKSGNHALVKACELLGVPATVEHRPYAQGVVRGETHLFIKRDPRNVLCSWLRWKGYQVTPGMFMSRLKEWDDETWSGVPRKGKTAPMFLEALDAYESWTRRAGVTVIAYEQLVASAREIQRIADVLGVPYIAGAFEDLPGYTRTWQAAHSDYRTIWTDQVAQTWADLGGPARLEAWGY